MLLFPNNSYIGEIHHTIVHCSRDAKVLYMSCITTKCVKSQQNYFFKKRYKKVYTLKEDLKKKLLYKISIYLF